MSRILRWSAATCCLVCLLGSSRLLGTAQESVAGQSEAVAENSARESPKAGRVRGLNNSLLLLHGKMQQVAPNEAELIRSQAATVIVARAAALSALIEQDPRTALSFAFSPELLADLVAKFPQSASLLESHLTVRGKLEHWIADGPDFKSSRSYFILKMGQQTLNLRFAGPVPNLKQGELLEATGVVIGSEMAVCSAQGVLAAAPPLQDLAPTTPTTLPTAAGLARDLPSPVPASLIGVLLLAVAGLATKTGRLRGQTLLTLKELAIYVAAFAVVASNSKTSYAQTSPCSTTGVQNTAVLLVNFADQSISVTPQQASDVFFDTSTGHSVNGFWQEASFGQTSASGSAFGPFTIGPSSSYTCSDVDQLFYDAVAAANSASVNLRDYTRIDLIFPGLSCGWAGLTSTGSAGAGCNTWNTSEGTLTASISFLASGYFTTNVTNAPSVRDQAVMLSAHENGHQLGLDHSGTITDEPTAVLGPVSNPGTVGEFGDFFSTMGAWTLGLYPAQHSAEILSWLALTANYQVVETTGTYTLEPLETAPAGLKALKVRRGTGNNAWLWVEYRQPVGNYDSTIRFMNFDGALIHYEDSSMGARTRVLDFTPTDVGAWYNTVLAVGQTWTDPYTNVAISVVSADSNGLTVSVDYGPVPCTPTNPTLSISPSNPSISAGSSADYTVSVTNNDAAGCASSSFDLGSSQPSGWPVTFSPTTLTLSPGQSDSVTMQKTAPSGTTPGTYMVDASATNAANSSFTGSATANVTVTRRGPKPRSR